MSARKKLTSTFSVDKNVEDVEYSDTLSSSYLDYSVSTIVDRAVPDLRDGLKPVQRRVLYDMYDLGFTHDKQYRKTARVSGDVIGRFHAHGQAGVETAIVTMAQPFKKPVTFIDGQGNWGSIEGDNPAAARYTECRLTEFSEDAFLDLLGSDTVDFQPNYDNTLTEPCCLPAKVPCVLLTGAEGIAVGMRTCIPTFNLSEAADANMYVLKHPKALVEKILELMPAPDFASGGVVCNASDMKSLYETGEGKVRIRGKVEFEPGKGKQRDRLVVTEVPYTMVGLSMISFMQSVVDLIESKQLPEVTDVIDQTGESPRIVLELAKGADPEYIKNVLFAKTKLEDSMSCNFLVVSNGRPETLGVAELLRRFSEFQKETYKRKYKHDLGKLESRKLVLEAYLTCSKNVKDVVSIVTSSRSVSEARQKLYEKYKFTEDQANAVLALRISRLVALEVEKVSKELSQVEKGSKECKDVLSDRKKLVRRICSDVSALKKKHAYTRRTQVADVPVAHVENREAPEQELFVLVDRFSYAHCIDSSTYERNKEAVEKDFKFCVPSTDRRSVLFMASNGMMYRVKCSRIPLGGLRHKGVPLESLTSGKYVSKDCAVVSVLPEDSGSVVAVAKSGKCKKLEPSELEGRRTETLYFALAEGDEVIFCSEPSKSCLTAVTSTNRLLTVKCSDVPAKRRGSKGVALVKFRSNSDFVKMVLETDLEKEASPLGWFGVKVTAKEAEKLATNHNSSEA